MTVIAWDGRTLAADRSADYAGIRLPVTKIHRAPNALVGISGTGAHGIAMLEWVRRGANVESYPQPASPDERAHVLVIFRDGRIHNYEAGGYYTPIEARTFLAMGSGRDVAMGAMAMGADAKRAVEIANMLCTTCGLGVDTLTFEDP